jgi:hypothetical protein
MQLAALAAADRQLAGARIIRCHPAAVDVSWQELQRRIDLTVGQEVRVAISEGKQSHAPENTHCESGGHLTRGEREAREALPRSLPVSRGTVLAACLAGPPGSLRAG